MSKITVINNVSLDGVMQAPARPDEDSRDGFGRGGWAIPYGDQVMAAEMGRGMASDGVLLFGRRTYLDLHQIWAGRTDNPYSEVLDKKQKFVVSATLAEPLPWQNSTLLRSVDDVAKLKAEAGQDIGILGSGNLIQGLRRRGLIDEYVLLIFPLLLGSGSRLFPDGEFASLRLTESVTTTTGVIIARYESE